MTNWGPILYVASEAANTTESSGFEPVTRRIPADIRIDRDEIMSITSEGSDGNMSIPHGELYDDTDQSIAIHQGHGAPRTGGTPQSSLPGSNENNEVSTSPVAMPPDIKAKLDAWYAVHGRVIPPCATSTIPEFLYSRNVSGELAYFVHKSGERLDVCMYPLFDVQVVKASQSKQRVIVAHGPTQGPFIIRYASQKNGPMTGTGYKIWLGVNGGDKDGFELKPSVHKRYKSTGTETPKSTQHAKKKVGLKKGGFRGNQFYEADGTPNSDTDSKRTHMAASSAAESIANPKSSYDFRPSKRPKEGGDTPANYNKLLAAFSSNAAQRKPSNLNQVIEHIQNNAVFLFYSKKSTQPRARLFSMCNTLQKLFAQTLAGDVFDDDTTGAKILSIRVAGQPKAKAVVEDDEQDFDDVVEELKAAPCWVRTASGEISGSCTVEVRARS